MQTQMLTLDSNLNDKWAIFGAYKYPILQYLEDPKVTEIFCRWNRVHVHPYSKDDETGGYQPGVGWRDEYSFSALIKAIAAALDIPIDAMRKPNLDARLPSGERISATLYPFSQNGSQLNIRKFPATHFTLADLDGFGMFHRSTNTGGPLAEHLVNHVKDGANLLISGPFGCGKTTLLRALATAIPERFRIGVIEDTQELQLANSHLDAFEVAERALDLKPGEKPITIADLMKWIRRKTYDRLIIGEIRDPVVAYGMLEAMRIGTKGNIASIHASSAQQALDNFSDKCAEYQDAPNHERCSVYARRHVDVIVHCDNVQGRREVAEVWYPGHSSFLVYPEGGRNTLS